MDLFFCSSYRSAQERRVLCHLCAPILCVVLCGGAGCALRLLPARHHAPVHASPGKQREHTPLLDPRLLLLRDRGYSQWTSLSGVLALLVIHRTNQEIRPCVSKVYNKSSIKVHNLPASCSFSLLMGMRLPMMMRSFSPCSVSVLPRIAAAASTRLVS